ncbi:MAG TPA: hypothetical protein PKL92_05655 [Aquaticitalea sp.]|nr:hypothetical protein [Aquaticitalea sp.]
MKKRIFFLVIVIVILVLLLLKFCNPRPMQPLEDGSKPSAAILKSELLRLSDDELKFAIDFMVFRDSKNTEGSVRGKDLSMDTLKRPLTVFSLTDFDKTNPKQKESFSAILLVDHSGSMNTNDRDKKRFMAANIFNQNFGNDNYLMLWAFGITSKGYGAIGQGFVQDTAMFKKQLDSLQMTRVAGGSPLFQAQDSTLQYLDLNAKTKIKALLSLTDGMAGGKKAYDQAVSRSLQTNVPLYNISLKKDSEVLRQQALETNGAYIYVEETEELLSIFGNLGSLVNKTAVVYHTEWVAKPVKGNLKFGKSLKHTLKVKLPYGEIIDLPFEIDLVQSN